MPAPLQVGDKGLFGRLKDNCGKECGCLVWLNDVVFKPLREAFWERKEEIDDHDDGDSDGDDDDKSKFD